MGRYHKDIAPWMMLTVLLCIAFMTGGLTIYPAIADSAIKTSLGLSNFQIGLLSSSYFLSNMIMHIPSGYCYDKFNSKLVIIIMILLIIIGAFIAALATNYTLLLIARVFMGAGASGLALGILMLSRNWFSKKTYPVVVGLNFAANAAGIMLFAIIYSMLLSNAPWQLPIYIIGFVVLFFWLLSMVFVREYEQPDEGQAHLSAMGSYRALLGNGLLWLFALFIFLTISHSMVFSSMWAIPNLQYTLKISLTDATLVNSAPALGFILGGIMYGLLCRRFVERKLIVYSSILLLLSLLACFATHNAFVISILLFCIGLFSASIVLCFNLVKLLFDKKHHGVIFGFLSMLPGLSNVLLNPVVSYIVSLNKDYFYIANLPIVLCFIIAVIIAFMINARLKNA